MLLLFLQWLSRSFAIKIPAVFGYASTRMILAALTALILTLVLGPWVIRRLYLLKTGQSIRVEACAFLADLHQHKKKTPTMGGVLILFSMVIALLLWMDWHSSFTLLLLLTTLWLGLLGGFDDYLKMKRKSSKGISSRYKFLLQLVFSTLFAAYLFYPPLTKAVQQEEWFAPPAIKTNIVAKETHELKEKQEQGYGHYYIPFRKTPIAFLSGWKLIGAFLLTILVISGTSNAVNFADGLDGLAAGLVLLVAVVLAVFAFLSNHREIASYLNIAAIKGSAEIGIYLCAVAGACLGFLWYNGYPAQVFMGDTGSLALGGILGAAAVLLQREFLLALVGGVFVIEVVSVMLQVLSYRYRNKKRIFRCTPLHHHFEFKGWPESTVVLRFWIIGWILALIGLSSLKFQ